MKHKFVLMLLILLFCRCSDFIDREIEEGDKFLETKAVIDSRIFDWNSSRDFKVYNGYNNDSISISFPWVGTSSIGVLNEYLDPDFQEGSPRNMYSKENGWCLLYHNLDYPAEPNKFFALYNKYSGKARFFFYSFANSFPSINTTTTFIGFKVNGNSSILNNHSSRVHSVNELFNGSMAVFSPVPPFKMGQSDIINGIGYQEKAWYAAEVEFYYDPSITNQTLQIFISSKQASYTISTGGITGKIEGVIESVAESPNNISLDLSKNETFNYSINTEGAVSVLTAKAEQDNSFFQKIVKNSKNWILDAAQKSGKELVAAIFSSGTSAIVKGFGGLVNNIFGIGQKLQVQKVDLSLKADLNINSETNIATNAWGKSGFLPLGKSSNSEKLYEGNLGSWRLAKKPVINVKRNIIGYYHGEPDPKSDLYVDRVEYLDIVNIDVDIELNPQIEKEYRVNLLEKSLILIGDEDLPQLANLPVMPFVNEFYYDYDFTWIINPTNYTNRLVHVAFILEPYKKDLPSILISKVFKATSGSLRIGTKELVDLNER